MRFLRRQCGLILVPFLAATLGLILVSCSTSHPAPPAPPQPYTRIFRPDSNIVQLQIAARKFTPAHGKGPVVWLVGASHIGEQKYYDALQKHLDSQTVVLFEGVNADSHKRRVRGAAGTEELKSPEPEPTSTPDSPDQPPGIQSSLAESLGLVFQLDAINYDRTNFLNSDLSIREIAQLMGGTPAPPPPPGTPKSSIRTGAPETPNASFNYLMQAMDGSSFLGSLMRIAVQFIGSSSSLRSLTKLIFIETIGQLKGDMSSMRGMPPDMQELLRVLIESRNKAVIKDLKTESQRLPRSSSIAIFYGTGHMDDMERRLTGELKFRPAEDVWFTAFSVDVRDTGLSSSQLQMVSNLIKWQMDQLK